MSALGQKQIFAAQKAMSALPLKADIGAAFEISTKGKSSPSAAHRYAIVVA
jgi:hypothetical protein